MTADRDLGQESPTEWGAQWTDRVRLRLTVHHKLPNGVVEEVMAEVRAAGAESGRPPVELFGPADEFAAETAAERTPLADKASVGARGQTPAGRRELLVGNGVVGLIMFIGQLLRGSWGEGVSAGGVVLLAGVHGSFLALGLAARARFAGRLRRSVGWGILVVASAGLAITVVLAMGEVKNSDLGRTPLVVLAVLSLAAIVLGCALPTRERTRPAEDLDPQEWFARLAGVLRGRWLLTAAEADRLTQETRAYWLDAGSPPPAREFGTPAEHAFGLVDASPVPGARAARWTAYGFSAFCVLWVFVLITDLVDGDTGWGFVLRAALAVFLVLRTVSAWRTVLRARVAPEKDHDDV